MITPEQLAKGQSEHAQQTALFCWAALPEVRAKYPELEWMFAIPNGGERNKIVASNMKAEGVKSGVWDIFLPVSNKLWHGLFIEMKFGDNILSENQNRFSNFLWSQRYQSVLCYSFEEAKNAIAYYLNLR